MKVIDFAGYLNKKAADQKIEERQAKLQDKVDSCLNEARQAAAVGDASTMLAKVVEAAEVEEKSSQFMMPAYCDPCNVRKGSKYEGTANLSVRDLPALMRQDIKDATARGQLPKGLKVSVRRERRSIDMRITGVPEGMPVLSQEYIDLANRNNWDYFKFSVRELESGSAFSPELLKCLDVLKSIYDAYQRDNSDTMSDYFDVRYYGGVSIDWKLERDAEEKAKGEKK